MSSVHMILCGSGFSFWDSEGGGQEQGWWESVLLARSSRSHGLGRHLSGMLSSCLDVESHIPVHQVTRTSQYSRDGPLTVVEGEWHNNSIIETRPCWGAYILHSRRGVRMGFHIFKVHAGSEGVIYISEP